MAITVPKFRDVIDSAMETFQEAPETDETETADPEDVSDTDE